MSDLIARLSAAWDNLSSRERLLLSALGGTFALVLGLVLVVDPLIDVARGASDQVDSAEQTLQGMTRLRREYDEVKARVATVEQKIQSQGPKRNLLTQLEGLAAKAKVKVDAMEERQAGNHERYGETKVEVSLKNVTLLQTVTYLHEIESSAQLLSVKSLRVRTQPSNPELLDVTFAVSSFEPI